MRGNGRTSKVGRRWAKAAGRRVWPALRERPGLVALLVAVGAAAAGRGLFSLPGQELFPHGEHVGLFPTCLGCHAGIPRGEAEAFYTVEETDCAACHDGRRLERVAWRPPRSRPSNLRFSHPEHGELVTATGDAALECGSCHQLPGTERRMEVARAVAETCLGCHAHRAEDHLAAEAPCGACHQALAGAGELSAARIGAFPVPAGHGAADFLFAHGEAAAARLEQCAICHARESCGRCHLNADRLEAVQAFPPDPRVASLLAGRPGEWPAPASHDRRDWALAHGEEARTSVESCANCHAAPSCTVCHGDPGPRFLATLRRPGPGEPTGVSVPARRPPGHTPDFAMSHGAAAATDLPACGSCHRESECAECHDRGAGSRGGVFRFAMRAAHPPAPSAGARDTVEEAGRGAGTPESGRKPREEAGATGRHGRRGEAPGPLEASAAAFHPMNFVLRHGAEAFAARSECAECHSSEAFCRSCHERAGFAAGRPLTGGAFHDAQPDWLLAHGRAGRQSLESCVGCHRQTSCLRCHSAKAGLRVSPHGPGFDPARVSGRSTISCGICHFSDQIFVP